MQAWESEFRKEKNKKRFDGKKEIPAMSQLAGKS